MGMKSLALASARPRIYSDLRAAAALGGYYFNLTSLAPRLDFTDPSISGENYTCDAAGMPQNTGAAGHHGVIALSGSAHVLQRIAASGF